MKLTASLVVLVALVAGCVPEDTRLETFPRATSSAEPSTSAPPTPGLPEPDAGPPLLATLPRECGRWRGEPKEAEITFVKNRRLYTLDPTTGHAGCIGRGSTTQLAWGALGDRLLTRQGTVAYGDTFRQELPGDVREESWSRPTGTSVVYVGHDFASLTKEEVATGEVTELTFLEQHFDVAYHPAGMHIAVSGQTSRGRVGLFLATNEGTEIQQIVRGETADYIDGLEFSHDGRFLYFRADHGDRLELHAVRIVTGEESADTERDLVTLELDTIYSGPKAPYWTVSPFSRKRRLLFTARCRDGREGPATIVQGDARTQLDPELGGIDPVGWLPDGSVAFLAFERAPCDDFGKGDLYLWNGGETRLLVNNVDAAAIRARLPAAPDPPARAQGVVA